MHARFPAGLVMLVVALSGVAAAAQPAGDAALAEAERQFEGFQFAAAIALLDPLIDRLDRPGSDRPEILARSLELRGRGAFNLGRAQAARADFVRLLEIDASAQLPADASPRLIELFDAVRAEMVGTLFVTMDPPGRLVVGGREFVLETFNATLDVLAGAHTVVASLADHRDQQIDVVIAPGRGYALDVRLERVFGSVIVATSPPGARVSVDGVYAGETVPGLAPRGPSVPVLVTELRPGQHRLRLERLCSAPQTLPFNIPDPPVDADLGVIELEPAVATADIVAPSPGATVYLDGLLRGRAPVRLNDVCAGEREIEVRTQGGRFVDRRLWRAGDAATLRVAYRWAFMLLPAGTSSGRDEGTLSRIEAALQDAQRVLVMTPRPAELAAVAGTDELISVVTDETRGVAERRAAGERLADALDAQGVLWATPTAGGTGDQFTLSVLARGSGVPDRLGLRLTDLGSLAVALGMLGPRAPAVTRPSLGVSLVDVADVVGAAIVRAPADSPAEGADLAMGDIVVGVNGAAVTSAGDVTRQLAGQQVGAELRLRVRRQGQNRTVTARVSETPDLIPLADGSRLANLLLPDLEYAVEAGATPLSESAARLNLAVAHIRLENWDRALSELDRVELPDGPGVSAGTVSYLSALCLLATGQLSAAEAALRHAVGAEESVLFAGGPRVSALAGDRLRDLIDGRR